MFKRNMSFCDRKREIITKTLTLLEKIVHINKKGKLHIINF